MTHILITGGAGNVGSALASKLAEDNSNYIVIIDNLSTGSLHKIPQKENVKFIKANCNIYNDIVPIFGRYNFNYVFHYAAVVGVKRTLANPISVLEDIEGIKNILSLSKNSGVERVFFSSSSEVYGEPFEIPQNEKTTPLNSRLPYAIVKNVGEAFFKSYQQEYGLNYTIFRFFNTYGPNQSEDFVITRFVKAALKNEPIYIYGDGMQTRSFCYVDDNITTCVKILNEGLCMNDVINIGSHKEQTILSLAEEIIKHTQSSSKIVFLPALPEGDMARRCPDNSKMLSILNKDLITLEEGIAKLTAFYKKPN
ncbi:epimerase [Flavobacterium columnare]|uniref:Udp-glucose 4-epimerase n=1 Tax=Flavobacterium columnare (strain ATCC 49512 / CIP 103533 / TG 44/87) TaxID=1041826 RepID=G8X9W7_FLACA|nr:NAD-dependent epimerase/dehydratase family protein [Flavobacterium columnare]AEW87315.1 udp-glucose 4-epimerase [Flavobacterium columnare ATCC 49512]MBF6652526.1 epimerase [Flavobacterium columnare]MBF6655540.1 epimerase [Flavobacterium columnare]MBF6658395.1 epimerase [Flavobacterium columnare]OOB81768.1 epimerase [Flavobacterium columnare]